MDEEQEKNEENINNKKRWIGISVLVIVLIGIVVLASIKIIQIANRNREQEKIRTNIENNNEKQSIYTQKSNSTAGIDYISPVYKPIIYIYPEEETSLVVKLGNPEKLTCTYPKYKETGWNVTAYPDGTLVDNETGRSLYSLYWEGQNTENIEFNEGFCIKGEDTIKFLEEKLEVLGLNEREAEEFIVYWLPKMEDNKYNLIRFASMEEIEENMPLEFTVEPDTLIRVLMEYKALDEFVKIPEQKLETPERTGFVAVEWGGTEVH